MRRDPGGLPSSLPAVWRCDHVVLRVTTTESSDDGVISSAQQLAGAARAAIARAAVEAGMGAAPTGTAPAGCLSVFIALFFRLA